MTDFISFSNIESSEFNLSNVNESKDLPNVREKSKLWLPNHLKSFSAQQTSAVLELHLREDREIPDLFKKVINKLESRISTKQPSKLNDRQSSDDLIYAKSEAFFFDLCHAKGRENNWAPFEKWFEHKSSFNLRSRACNLGEEDGERVKGRRICFINESEFYRGIVTIIIWVTRA